MSSSDEDPEADLADAYRRKVQRLRDKLKKNFQHFLADSCYLPQRQGELFKKAYTSLDLTECDEETLQELRKLETNLQKCARNIRVTKRKMLGDCKPKQEVKELARDCPVTATIALDSSSDEDDVICEKIPWRMPRRFSVQSLQSWSYEGAGPSRQSARRDDHNRQQLQGEPLQPLMFNPNVPTPYNQNMPLAPVPVPAGYLMAMIPQAFFQQAIQANPNQTQVSAINYQQNLPFLNPPLQNLPSPHVFPSQSHFQLSRDPRLNSRDTYLKHKERKEQERQQDQRQNSNQMSTNRVKETGLILPPADQPHSSKAFDRKRNYSQSKPMNTTSDNRNQPPQKKRSRFSDQSSASSPPGISSFQPAKASEKPVNAKAAEKVVQRSSAHPTPSSSRSCPDDSISLRTAEMAALNFVSPCSSQNIPAAEKIAECLNAPDQSDILSQRTSQNTPVQITDRNTQRTAEPTSPPRQPTPSEISNQLPLPITADIPVQSTSKIVTHPASISSPQVFSTLTNIVETCDDASQQSNSTTEGRDDTNLQPTPSTSLDVASKPATPISDQPVQESVPTQPAQPEIPLPETNILPSQSLMSALQIKKEKSDESPAQSNLNEMSVTVKIEEPTENQEDIETDAYTDSETDDPPNSNTNKTNIDVLAAGLDEMDNDEDFHNLFAGQQEPEQQIKQETVRPEDESAADKHEMADRQIRLRNFSDLLDQNGPSNLLIDCLRRPPPPTSPQYDMPESPLENDENWDPIPDELNSQGEQLHLISYQPLIKLESPPKSP